MDRVGFVFVFCFLVGVLGFFCLFVCLVFFLVWGMRDVFLEELMLFSEAETHTGISQTNGGGMWVGRVRESQAWNPCGHSEQCSYFEKGDSVDLQVISLYGVL